MPQGANGECLWANTVPMKKGVTTMEKSSRNIRSEALLILFAFANLLNINTKTLYIKLQI